MNFSSTLINWYSKNKRKLPWRTSPKPYNIWLSEVIMQQTRIDQGTPYYQKFIARYPDVNSLAKAKESEVLKLWQGLGYYSRARNLHAAAKQVVETYKGEFPSHYTELLKLKGVGAYSAAAISSICNGEAIPVVDGNVFRFLSRHFGIDTPIDTSGGQKQFRELAERLIDHNRAGDFNQAIMEFGALVCTPKKPNCHSCPFKNTCTALREENVTKYPIKARKVQVKKLHIHYFVVKNEFGVYLKQRSADSFWARMYDFPCATFVRKPLKSDIIQEAEKLGISLIPKKQKPVQTIHLLTHRQLNLSFWWGAKSKDDSLHNHLLIRSQEDLRTLALPKPIVDFLEQHFLASLKKL